MLTLELMKTHVVKTTPDVSIREAIDQMDIYQVDSMPVADEDGRLVGMISEKEILTALSPEGSPPAEHINDLNASCSEKSVSEFMTPPRSILENEDAKVAVLFLLNSKMNRIPVVDSERIVVGTLNRIDVFQALFDGVLK